MSLESLRLSLPCRIVSFGAAITFCLSITFAPIAQGQDPPKEGTDANLADASIADKPLNEWWDRVNWLRISGDYDQAVELLGHIIMHYQNTEDVLRRAYHHLVHIKLSIPDVAGAVQTAREALMKFPDLRADPIDFPPSVNNIYDEQRKDMFGALTITEPESCRVFLNQDFMGKTPLELPLVAVGRHELSLCKSGYNDYVDSIFVSPQDKIRMQVPMERQRDAKWWLSRLAAPTVAVAAIVVALSRGSSEESDPEPLPGPPDPPSDR